MKSKGQKNSARKGDHTVLSANGTVRPGNGTARRESGKESQRSGTSRAKTPRELRLPALEVRQGPKRTLYCFASGAARTARQSFGNSASVVGRPGRGDSSGGFG